MSESQVLEEVIEENYEPTEEEVVEYAKWLGMDLPGDATYLYIAREGLKAPIPSPWKPCQTQDGNIYFFNFESGDSTWDHPCDQHYKQLFQEAKKRVKSPFKRAEDKGLSERQDPLLEITALEKELKEKRTKLREKCELELQEYTRELQKSQSAELKNYQKQLEQDLSRKKEHWKKEAADLEEKEKTRAEEEIAQEVALLRERHRKSTEEQLNKQQQTINEELRDLDNREQRRTESELESLRQTYRAKMQQINKNIQEETEQQERYRNKARVLEEDFEDETKRENKALERNYQGKLADNKKEYANRLQNAKLSREPYHLFNEKREELSTKYNILLEQEKAKIDQSARTELESLQDQSADLQQHYELQKRQKFLEIDREFSTKSAAEKQRLSSAHEIPQLKAQLQELSLKLSSVNSEIALLQSQPPNQPYIERLERERNSKARQPPKSPSRISALEQELKELWHFAEQEPKEFWPHERSFTNNECLYRGRVAKYDSELGRVSKKQSRSSFYY